MKSLKNFLIIKPDDWHLHLREGIVLKNIIKFSSNLFGRAVVMPNTKIPITSIEKALAYKNLILESLPPKSKFQPLMTLYLTDNVSEYDLKEGFKNDIYFAAKLYPSNTTTNSNYGVTDIKNLFKIFGIMEEIGMPLSIHGEVNDPKVDIFDREEVFIDKELTSIVSNFPKLKIVLEHITTRYAVDFVKKHNIGATITPHHLHINRNAMFFGGLNSDFYCLPVAKREFNREALIDAATSGEECFFLGTDSAPHLREWKAFCGCAGIFNAPIAIESYLQIFEEKNALDKFEKFASLNGPKFYKLPINNEKIMIHYEPHLVQEFIEIVDNKKIIGKIKSFHAGHQLNWKAKDNI